MLNSNNEGCDNYQSSHPPRPSFVTSVCAGMLSLSGLLLISAILLQISAELPIELGRVVQKHGEEQQLYQLTNDLTSWDTIMERSTSLGSMKRVALGNS